MILSDPRCLDHDPSPHPESPERLRAVLRALEDRGTATETAPPADRETLTAVHDGSYLDALQAFCEDGGGRWGADTAAVPATLDAARASAGLAVAAVERDEGPAFALGRPPGHHATRDDAGGFCFLNNVAVAVERALSGAAERVAVVDWDVHHGNGTQDHFWRRGDVLYASMHARGLYPNSGAAGETGAGDGEGTTLNLPLPGTAGDAAVLAAYDRVVDPVLRGFDPDLVVVSAGFDAHRRDPLSRTRMTTDGFRSLAGLVARSASAVDAAGPAAVLEGGYDPDALAESVLATWDALGAPGAVDVSVPGSVASLVSEQRERFGVQGRGSK